MISRLLALLTIAAMLSHSVLGCCWHHGHDVCTKSAHPEIRRPVGGCSSHRHHSHAHAHETPEAPCEHEHEVCPERPCVYVAARHFELRPAATPGLPVYTEVTRLTAGTLETSIRLSRATDPPRPLAPELRALLQVWVI